MNSIYLSGILKNIMESHKINDTLFNKAELITKRENGKEDIIDLKFKALSNSHYKENDYINLTGNIRSFSEKSSEESRVHIYVFTYFDSPASVDESITNKCEIDGRICKINEIRNTKDGKQNIHLILANNIDIHDHRRLSSYIPCIAWGNMAKNISRLSVNTPIKIIGQLHSREHKKNDEIRVAHELLINDFMIL